tara:strand:+ start:1125 stop:1454 length:330 start_codon:yes stop_codon:yes gene_type:complete
MKKLILLLFIPLVFDCSNMESDAERVCNLTTLTIDVKPAMEQLAVKVGFGDEESKKEAQKQLDELEVDIKILVAEIENIKVKYDEDEFQAYLLENCEGFKKRTEMRLVN